MKKLLVGVLVAVTLVLSGCVMVPGPVVVRPLPRVVVL